MYERLVRRLFRGAGIECDGNNPWDIQVKDSRFYRRVLIGGSLGLGEAYLDGWWTCSDLSGFFLRLIRSGVGKKIPRIDELFLKLFGTFVDRQNKKNARRVASEHYDLDPDFFIEVLGETNSYTCARWNGTEDLDTAQRLKMNLLCRKAGLAPGMTVLDIGCGWGGFLAHAAQRHGVNGIGISISEPQLRHAAQQYHNLPIKWHKLDYRDFRGAVDAVVSICMIEHVGMNHYREYLEAVRRALPKAGLFVMQCITTVLPRSVPDPWIDKYIFPGGTLVSPQVLKEAARGILHVIDEEYFGPDYDKTLQAWYANLRDRKDAIVAKYGIRHFRKYEYYFLACAGAFRSAQISVGQIVFSPTDLRGSYVPVRL